MEPLGKSYKVIPKRNYCKDILQHQGDENGALDATKLSPSCLVGMAEWIMGTIIGDYIGTTIGIHPPFPTKNQGVLLSRIANKHILWKPQIRYNMLHPGTKQCWLFYRDFWLRS